MHHHVMVDGTFAFVLITGNSTGEREGEKTRTASLVDMRDSNIGETFFTTGGEKRRGERESLFVCMCVSEKRKKEGERESLICVHQPP